MSEQLGTAEKTRSNVHSSLQERIEEANPHRELTGEENKRLGKLEGIADKL